MSAILTKNTKVLVQGITGHQGSFNAGQMMEFGTKVVGGVTPGKSGETVLGLPVFDTMAEAVKITKANTSIVFVPAPFAKDAVLEAVDAGIKTVAVITERIPVRDSIEFIQYAKLRGTRIVGPNCPGLASPGKAKVGIMPNSIFSKGKIGVVSRSGTLTYEIVNALTESGLGQSTVIGIGGDPVIGTSFVDALRLFERDRETESIVLIGEIGGTAEEEAAEFIRKRMSKPVFAYVAGRMAPPGKRMGHAGAIIARGRGTAQSKISSLEAAGVKVASVPAEVPKIVLKGA
ncbi:MAG: succinate--CoA ligase subunit alpha [Methanomassiliicoccales archaeon]|nr:succinate--CoA ligase subunit alpha [Methanomassiliicoccales archaeon]